jgi:hypothetical protein
LQNPRRASDFSSNVSVPSLPWQMIGFHEKVAQKEHFPAPCFLSYCLSCIHDRAISTTYEVLS